MNPPTNPPTASFPGITQTIRIAPITLAQKMLLWLLRYPLQRMEDLALALEANQSTIARHLAQLGKAGLVEYVTPSLGRGNAVQCYYLTQQGLLAAAAQERADPVELARRWHADERGLLRLLPRIHQVLTLQEIVNRLVASSPTALAYPGGHPATIHWHWRRDYQQTFLSHRRTLLCRADAALVFSRLKHPAFPALQETIFSLLLIVEGITEMDAPIIRQRLMALLNTRESRERLPFYPHFPPLLVVVASQHQRAVWQRCVREVAVTRRVQPLVGAIAVVPRRLHATSLSAIASLAWHHLATSSSCRWQDLLTPTPPEDLLSGIMPSEANTQRSPQPLQPPGAKKAGMIRGQFATRAASLSFQEHLSLSEERETIALMSLRLHPRHLALLRLIYRSPLLSTAEVAAIAQIREETCQRYLADLRQMGNITASPATSHPRWLVHERGLHVLAQHQQVSLRRLTEEAQTGSGQRVQRGVKMLTRNLSHTIGVYHFLALLYRAASQQDHHQVLWFEAGPHSERSYRSHGTWRNIRPDATIAYQAGAQRLLAWLEWDEGSMMSRNLAAKLYAYQRFLRGREWGSYDTKVLPLLLFVVPDRSQELRIGRLAQGILAQEGMIIRSTTITRLTEYGPLAAIWLPVVPPLPEPTRHPLLDMRSPHPRNE